MVSTSTQIAGFAFDNCLMNAARVACMTKRNWQKSKILLRKPCDQGQQRLEFRQKPRTALSGCSAGVYQHGACQIMDPDYYGLPARNFPGEVKQIALSSLSLVRYVARRSPYHS